MKSFITIIIAVSIVGLYMMSRGHTPSFTFPTFNTKSIATIPSIPTLSVWIPWWAEEQALTSWEKSEDKITTILPVWYGLDENGKIYKHKSSKKEAILQKASQSKTLVIPTISNAQGESFDPKRVQLLISNEELKEEFVNYLISEAVSQGYHGWDLDFESLTDIKAEEFSDFVAILADRLKQKNLTLSVTVHAKTASEEWDGAKAQDWEELSEHADLIRIMAYDFHYAHSKPGPVTPITALHEVMRRAKRDIPPEKTAICLPAYGYDWDNEKGTGVSYQQATEKLSLHSIKPHRDTHSQALTAQYTEGDTLRTIWYEDATSIWYKINQVKEQGYGNICMWHLGVEDPKLWEYDF